MAETIVINEVSINPNIVETGGTIKIIVDIYILYPSNGGYPSEKLYPTPDTGTIRPYVLYPQTYMSPSVKLYPA